MERKYYRQIYEQRIALKFENGYVLLEGDLLNSQRNR